MIRRCKTNAAPEAELVDLSPPNQSRILRCGTRAAPSLVVALAVMGLTGEAAWADCTPAFANNVIATCTGTTLNQGGGAPGTSTGTSGYGTGTETGITVTVDSNATVTGSSRGILIGGGTVTNDAGATITGPGAIRAATGSVTVTNSGSILGGPYANYGIVAYTDATVTNNAGATITGGLSAVNVGHFANGSITLINSGSVTNTVNGYADLFAHNNVTVTNNAGASITGYGYGIWAQQGFVNITNSGSITGQPTR